MQQTIDFLERVLPDEGYYVSTTIQANGAKYNRFASSIADLARNLLAEDTTGRSVYHGCASFREPKHDPRTTPRKERRFGRTVHNVISAASLWLDVDAGEGKPYADAIAAAEAVRHFLAATGLPAPLYVSSGNGLHLYWPLVVNLDPADWLRYARGLRSLCGQMGLAADPARTCDLSSILRTPGTHWRKSGERLVFAGPLVGPYELDLFEGLLHVEQTETRKVYNGVRPRIAEAASILYSNDASSGDEIGRKCHQLAQMRDSHGCLPEPLWYAALGVLAFCQGGDDLGHEWSSGYEGYTEAETQARLDRARQFGPTTCEKFHSLSPAVCEACPHWRKITSPIVLGRTESLRQDVSRDRPEVTQQIKLPDMPTGFSFGPKKDRLQTDYEDGQGRPVSSLISANPLYVDGVQRGEIGRGYHAAFRHHVPALGWQDISVRLSDLFGPVGISKMSDDGVLIHDHQSFTRYARSHIQMHMQMRVATQYEQFGWKPEGFLYGMDLYAPTGTQRVAGSNELQLRSRDGNVGPAPGGDVRVWTDCVDALFAKDCEAQAVALFASFGAPLVRLVEADEGGVILHLVTARSGTGKTWALFGGMSVWSRRWGLRMTAETSQISKALTMGAIGNLPIFHDELTIRDPEELRSFITQFTEGTDKQRATRAGELKHSSQTWQTVLLSASNMSIRDALTANNQVHPMAARVIELNSELPKGVDFYKSERWKKALFENSGHAGAAFLEYLVQPEALDFAKEEIDRTLKYLWDPRHGFDSRQRYWIRGVAVMRVGAMIARHLGLIRVDVDAKLRWLWDRMREVDDTDKRHWAIEMLAQYLEQHRAHTLAMPGPWRHDNDGRVLEQPTKELWIRWEQRGRRYIVEQARFREWLTKQQVSYKETVRALREEGVVQRTSYYATLGAGTNKAGPQVYCLEVDGGHPLLAGAEPQLRADNVVQMNRAV